MSRSAWTMALWRQRGAAVLAFAVTVLAVGLWWALSPREYTATAAITATADPTSVRSADSVADTMAWLGSSRPVLMEVRDQVGHRRTTAQLAHEVSAACVGDTELIRIRVTDSNPTYARDVANAIAGVLPLHDPTGGRLRFTDAGRATVPTAYSTPDTARFVVGGLLAALAVAVAVGLLRERVWGTVGDPARLAELTERPVLARLVRPDDTRTTPADAPFRTLRVGLEFASDADITPVVVVAPMTVEPASSWLVMNLAASLAQVRRSVLVVDADPGERARHPALRRKGPGLAEVLDGQVEAADAVRPSDLPGVSVLGVGRVTDTALPDLLEYGFHGLVPTLTDSFDVVLVHAAPLDTGEDAKVLAVGHGLLLVAPAGRVPARHARRLVADLRRLRLRVLGSVLMAPRRRW